MKTQTRLENGSRCKRAKAKHRPFQTGAKKLAEYNVTLPGETDHWVNFPVARAQK